MCVCIYIYIYILERERESGGESGSSQNTSFLKTEKVTIILICKYEQNLELRRLNKMQEQNSRNYTIRPIIKL